MTGIPIATPRVGGARQDSHPRWPNPRGGQNGTIALPSRMATAEGTGTPAGPGPLVPRDGARGAVARIFAYTDNPWNWAAPASRRNATPIAYRLGRYIRQYAPNVAGIRGFAMTDADTVWTTNRVAGDPQSPGSPVPFSRKRVVECFAPDFDTRVWTVYAPRAIVQRPQAARRVVAGPAVGRRMAAPWWFNLTRLQPTTTYGDVTQTLPPPNPPASPANTPNPPGPKSGANGLLRNIGQNLQLRGGQ